ncbi:MAG: pyridoxine 5'-phosphate synthase [Cytophagia bacterium]|nr:MAG: pyridoxine 5'-phosphate synthase [Cytophagia bacterium]TAG44669.1 MAG: pyridoxine 5'-phosphate synthase [Cytophagia bacterium]TAH30671.1 MAG: pyridoxine 5'-phosphate synthase [Cytophagales bacterium]
MTKLSVNINKFATLRNARGGNNPNILKIAEDCQRFGADGITVHPRPDERHIRYQDVIDLKSVVYTEFNIEGNPTDDFIDLVLKVKPTQVTLVPDAPDVLTSDTGWDTIKNADFLKDILQIFRDNKIRTSIFLNPEPNLIEGAAKVGADRIEFYTGFYAHHYHQNKEKAIQEYSQYLSIIKDCGLGLNAGHDLDLNNLAYFKKNIPSLLEVSIGHALVCDAIYLGLENTIQLYKRQLED